RSVRPNRSSTQERNLNQITHSLPKPTARNPIKLTPREIEILSMILKGQTNKAICIELGLCHSTVERHRESLHRKFGVRCLTDLVRAAIYWDYVDLITFLEPLRNIPGART